MRMVVLAGAIFLVVALLIAPAAAARVKDHHSVGWKGHGTTDGVHLDFKGHLTQRSDSVWVGSGMVKGSGNWEGTRPIKFNATWKGTATGFVQPTYITFRMPAEVYFKDGLEEEMYYPSCSLLIRIFNYNSATPEIYYSIYGVGPYGTLGLDFTLSDDLTLDVIIRPI